MEVPDLPSRVPVNGVHSRSVDRALVDVTVVVSADGLTLADAER
jgi:hypothetical protein